MYKEIGILNYGIGNIQSFVNALEKISIKFKLINNPKEIKKFDKLVLIGVGSFSSCKVSLDKKKFSDEITKFVKKKGYLLGICVGMQVLLEMGTENKNVQGLGFVKGEVSLMAESKAYPLPHIGWNEISKIDKNFKLFEGIDKKSNFYFLHSYMVKPKKENLQEAESTYGKNRIIAAFRKNNIFGVQFHPEKSQEAGMKLIKNFVNIANAKN